MKVAIVGAGPAGLTCAHELIRHGIKPDIYEMTRIPEEAFIFNIATLQLFNMYKGSPMSFTKKSFGLHVEPVQALKKIVMHSPHHQTLIHGTLGYTFKRGPESIGLSNQILSNIKGLRLYKDTYVDPLSLQRKYNYVIVATGNPYTASLVGVWNTSFQSYVRSALVTGDFEKSTVHMWLNTEFSKQSFAFLLPHYPREANLVLITNHIAKRELDHYWKRFLDRVILPVAITETYDREFVTGFPSQLQFENLLFIGNAGGFCDNVLGFGTFISMQSGKLAAESILRKKSFDDLAAPIRKRLKNLHEYRKLLNDMDNTDFDRLVKVLNTPVLKQFLYNNPSTRLYDYPWLPQLYRRLMH